MESRQPRYPIGPRAIEHLAQREELAQLSPRERHARMQEIRKERVAERAQLNKLKGEERQKLRQQLRAKKP